MPDTTPITATTPASSGPETTSSTPGRRTHTVAGLRGRCGRSAAGGGARATRWSACSPLWAVAPELAAERDVERRCFDHPVLVEALLDTVAWVAQQHSGEAP
jgi:hypothetical protein